MTAAIKITGYSSDDLEINQTYLKSVKRGIVSNRADITLSEAVYLHNYLFPHNEKRCYRNKLTLVGENVIYLGVSLKDKTNRHWAVEKLITKKDNEYYIYEIKSERWYFKTEQPELLEIHANSKFLGFRLMPTEKKHTKNSELRTLRAAVSKPLKTKLPIRRDVKDNEFKCCYCEVSLTKSNYTKEHLIPRDRGGTDVIKNLRPCCIECNTEKDNLMLHSYIQYLNYRLGEYAVGGEAYSKLQTKIKNANDLAIQIGKA